MFSFSNKTRDIIMVEGIQCDHCKKKIIEELKKYGVKCTIDRDKKSVRLQYDNSIIELKDIKKIINELGYSVI